MTSEGEMPTHGASPKIPDQTHRGDRAEHCGQTLLAASVDALGDEFAPGLRHGNRGESDPAHGTGHGNPSEEHKLAGHQEIRPA